MREVYLYGCEECGVVISVYEDKGNKFFISACVGCMNHGRFYERIYVGQGSNLYKESHFYVNKEENDKKEGEVD